jgi:hypothetical protein
MPPLADGALVLAIFAAAAVSDFWRVLGALLASRIDERSQLFRLVRAVATALVSALLVRLVVYPTGAMASVPLALRLGSMAVGFVAYLALRRSLVAGTLACEVTLAGGVFLAA